MKNRVEYIQKLLEGVIGNKNVYFQPPSNVYMRYPAIVYSVNMIKNRHADDKVYKRNDVYKITVIDKNPDSEIVERMLDIPYCSFDRMFTSDNLNHFVFTLYS